MKKVILLGAAGLGLAACAVPPPSGPTLIAMPPQGKDYGQFQREDATCQQSAGASIGYADPSIAAGNAAVGSAAVGTVVGAAAGALIGAAAGNPGAGAAVGAGAGLVTGSAVGANNAAAAGYDLQSRYDMTYAQCMTAYGNQIQAQPVAAPTGYYSAPYYPPVVVAPYPYLYGPRFYGGGYWGGWRGGWGYRGGWGHGYRGGWGRRW